MERSWSEAARAALDAYPWGTPREKARARAETELVSFGERVEVADLPLSVRRWLKARKTAESRAGWVWKGEAWKELTEGFEKAILAQALAAHDGFAAKTARALRTTPRVISYKARKYGLLTKQNKKEEEKDK